LNEPRNDITTIVIATAVAIDLGIEQAAVLGYVGELTKIYGNTKGWVRQALVNPSDIPFILPSTVHSSIVSLIQEKYLDSAFHDEERYIRLSLHRVVH